LTLTAKKVRDGEIPAPLSLTRQRVHFAEVDRHGRPVTSCVIDQDSRTAADRQAEQQHTMEAEQRATDLSVLRVIRDYPTATSITALRPYIGLRTELVKQSVDRILRANLVLMGKRGQPYTLTEAGLATLTGATP